MKKYIFKKGGVLNPAKNSSELEKTIFSIPRDYSLYVYDKDDILLPMEFWQKAKEKNIKFILIEESEIFSRHASGYWYEFIIPRIIVDNNNIKLIRWLNFYRKRNK